MTLPIDIPSPQSASTVQHDAETLYQYHQLHMTIDQTVKVDAIFCLCSLDLRVAERAAQLFLDGHGGHLIFSGGSGKLTQDRFMKPEAHLFADVALKMGVPGERLIIEPNSTNTGENVRFTYKLLQEKGLSLSSFLLVQKPYMERRTYATFKKQWPDASSTLIFVTSPRLSWKDYPNHDNPVDLVINIAVGDLVRIKEYPAKGYQIPQEIPDLVWMAARRLIQAGYNKHLP
ncbi:DUF218 domain-containing protein [Xylariaceae sp. FL1272]|nr:DUF218 domain-containing protein [Xylariaceae sp. FL1272]